ncbi:hypothetical protein, partial [Ectothiorhodospira mobilis]|uniref:hypothetical protein n=1 Tax=Ectothiorhodospira mobilis TaxID=195064 RepID=UPI001C433639
FKKLSKKSCRGIDGYSGWPIMRALQRRGGEEPGGWREVKAKRGIDIWFRASVEFLVFAGYTLAQFFENE